MTLVANIAVHTQQICALVWAPNGRDFISGSNDNTACYFEIQRMLRRRTRKSRTSSADLVIESRGPTDHSSDKDIRSQEQAISRDGWLNDTLESLLYGTQVEQEPTKVDAQGNSTQLRHGAAVKAISFCPWQNNLIATGGGSSDKCIHFWHATTGVPLATIAVSAQVTSLIWSKTRPEIAATFGFATPDHPYRIAVFSWPSCKQVGAIAWENGPRALHAIAYPGVPSDVRRGSRTWKEGVIVVATSDENIRFHEIWQGEPRRTMGGVGMLGYSDILEGLDGIDKEGGVIR
ncbi:meiosis-specific apc c activator protein ama1 [Colletotrichum truncatum]|uniref:Meiosis-specific apc c activator protein ama1 n=1 Tax=Colletotrichum truncatum TaxID=5467 RepID=A0ACC3Z905_COLTU